MSKLEEEDRLRKLREDEDHISQTIEQREAAERMAKEEAANRAKEIADAKKKAEEYDTILKNKTTEAP